MTLTEFETRMSDTNIPAYLREIAQTIISKLRVDFDGTIEMSRKDFFNMCHHARVEPNKTSSYTWFRLYDDMANSVDVQTLNDSMEIVEPLKQALSND